MVYISVICDCHMGQLFVCGSYLHKYTCCAFGPLPSCVCIEKLGSPPFKSIMAAIICHSFILHSVVLCAIIVLAFKTMP